MHFLEYVYLELIKAGLGCVMLALGWFVGQRIIAFWDMRKKRQEVDLQTAKQFHQLYGEFKEVSRLWRIFSFPDPRDKPVIFPETLRFELLRRATAAEGGIESVTVKLASERLLSAIEIKTLGLFRQAYQQLREAIRDGKEFRWTHETPAYGLYNDLASATASIIFTNESSKPPRSEQARQQLRNITAFRPEQWNAELASRSASQSG